MMLQRRSRIWLQAAALCASGAFASPAVAQFGRQLLEQSISPAAFQEQKDQPVSPYWQWKFEGNAAAFYRMKVDLRGENSRLGSAGGILSFKASTQIDRDLSHWTRLIYSYESFDFGGSGGAAGWGSVSPWGDIHTFDLTLNFAYDTNSDWTIFGGPILRTSREWAGDFGRSLTAGGFGGLAYRFSPEFTVGFGVGLTTDIRDSNRVFPILVLDWKIAEGIFLKTYNGQNFNGIELSWDFARNWQLGLGAATQFKQFVLDGSGIAPGGVGEESGIPIWARISYQLNDNLRVDLQGGFYIDTEIELLNKERVNLKSGDYETQPFASLNLRLEF